MYTSEPPHGVDQIFCAQWAVTQPGGTKENGQINVAFLVEKSVDVSVLKMTDYPYFYAYFH